MTRKEERRAAGVLWTLYGVLSILGLCILAEALFARHDPKQLKFTGLPRVESRSTQRGLPNLEGLVSKRMTRRIEGKAAAAPSKPAAVTIESLVRLTGILDFGGKQPSLAVIETLPANESKAYAMGDKVGETGVLVREIGESVVVEFDNRRYRLSFTGVQELPPRALGTTGSGRSGD